MAKSRESHSSKTSKNNLNRGDSHVSHNSMGMGDYYGMGLRNKVGRIREDSGNVENTSKNIKKPPRSLA